ncbi:MAG: pyridoxal-phosphate dependent enzyme [Deltaproteobacteria bacterium]|nr:pyridoxal-phosphate dependent enzyme [Deltaproteobacteria bacterium]
MRSILEKIGNTPLVRLREVTRGLPEKVEVWVKVEYFNPGGSVKDRPAYRMISEGVKSGQLTKDKIIMDPTSGNTGVAYSLIGAVLGYKVELVVPENVSRQRKEMALSFGASLTYSSAMDGSDGAIRLAHKLKQENPEKYFMPDQYSNRFNPQAHYDTTGVEIYEQTGRRVTHFITGIGTSGTVMGVSRRLKDFRRDIKCYASEPAEQLHGLEGLKHMASSIIPAIYHPEILDGVFPVETETGYAMAERLAKEEGLCVGHSSGGNVAGAIEVASRLKEGVVVTILCDHGDRYVPL